MSVVKLKSSSSNNVSKHSKSETVFGKILTKEHVVQQFFNQMVQYLITDMVFIETQSKPRKDQKKDEIKEFKELSRSDLKDSEVVAVLGSKVSLARRNNKPSRTSSLEVIQEEESQKSVSIFFTNGNIYEGELSDGTMEGTGKYFWTDGTIYEGDFKDGFPTGNGQMVLPDLSWYQGEFLDGLFHGKGFLNVVSTPTFYSGDWKCGQRHGYGWVLYEPGDWYEGDWEENYKAGFGLRNYSNGAKYRGEWYQGKPHGTGIMIWENNDYYKGEWCNGTMHGKGEYIWDAFYNNNFAFPIQNIYTGTWENGYRSGYGTMIFGDASGMKLTGNWTRDLKNDYGFLTCGNGKTIEDATLFRFDKPLQIENSTWSMRGYSNQRLINFPIFSPPEDVDISFYIEKLLSNLEDVINNEKLKTLVAFEEKYVRNVIIKNLPRLKELYEEYASVGSKAVKLNFETIMIRLFLWTMYKDKALHKIGVSLAQTDRILADNPKSCLNSVHDPFEPLYFWQFLMSLIGVALLTADLERVYENSSDYGVSACVLQNFLDDVIFAPNEPKSSFVLSHLDLAPIESVYKFYQTLGEPFFARSFLRQSCKRRGQNLIQCHLNMTEKQNAFGTNLVPLNHHLIFENQILIELEQDQRHNWRNLFDLRHLGPRNIVQCLKDACPLIVEENLIVNIDYELVFLEFYEALLYSIFLFLELEMKKEQKTLSRTVSNQSVSTRSNLSKKLKDTKKNKKKKKSI